MSIVLVVVFVIILFGCFVKMPAIMIGPGIPGLILLLFIEFLQDLSKDFVLRIRFPDHLHQTVDDLIVVACFT